MFFEWQGKDNGDYSDENTRLTYQVDSKLSEVYSMLDIDLSSDNVSPATQKTMLEAANASLAILVECLKHIRENG